MADVLKYGWVRGGKEGVERTVVKNISFHRLGGAFVSASGADGVTLVTASTMGLYGWAEVPRDESQGTVDYWQSTTTSNTDKVFVITDPTAIFALPAIENRASCAASIIGYAVCASADGANTATGTKQYADCQPTTEGDNAQFFVVDVDADNKIMYVRINPANITTT